MTPLQVGIGMLALCALPAPRFASNGTPQGRTAVAIERIQAILDTDDTLQEKPDARDPAKVRGEIASENVAFAIDPKAPVLRGASVTIAPGRSVG